jgi:AraC-like DNA-binding protein
MLSLKTNTQSRFFGALFLMGVACHTMLLFNSLPDWKLYGYSFAARQGFALAYAPLLHYSISSIKREVHLRKIWVDFIPSFFLIVLASFFLVIWDNPTEGNKLRLHHGYTSVSLFASCICFIQFVAYYWKTLAISSKPFNNDFSASQRNGWDMAFTIVTFTSMLLHSFAAVFIEAPMSHFIFLSCAAIVFIAMIYSYEIRAKTPDNSNENLSDEADTGRQIEVIAAKYSILADRMRREIMKQSLFKDPDISLTKLAAILKTKPYVVSWILKNHYEDSFYNYINRLRIEEAKTLLSDAAYKNYTIDYIGQLVGFNSRSSFYAAFKKHTGDTPSQFVKKDEQEVT